MSSTQDIQPFKGGSWKECGAFIQRVRAAAWKEGKLRDPAWMADFASLHFLDYALVWYFSLPLEVQQDWSQLQAALLGKWSPPSGDDFAEPPNGSAVADAPSEQLDHMERAILKVVVAGKAEAHYVGVLSDDKNLGLTGNAEKALRFHFNPHSDLTHFELIVREKTMLVARSSLGAEQTEFRYAELTAVNCETLKSPVSRGGPFQIAMFRIARSGEVTPLWRDGNTETSLKAFTTSFTIFATPDPESYGNRYGSIIPVTLFIQKVD
ncbi:hypothetical protein FS837_003225 [Tulasnella sp. UAMH 9824]|nr:hypothetical protein FS837_003225 [Tulasnella sp. UAMH 9824]